MRGISEAAIRRARPVLRVVSRLKAWPTEVGDFVMLVTGCGRFLDHESVHLGGQIIIRLRSHAAIDLIVKRRSFVDVEQIKREMFRAQLQRLFEISFPAIDGLPW